MLVKPTVAELKEKVKDNRYALAIMTSKRARQIVEGSPKRVVTDDKSPVTIAAEEIEEGEVYNADREEEKNEEENKVEE